jgi:hypothetical protein
MRNRIDDPVPAGNAAHALGILLKHLERLHELIFQRVKAVKNSIVKIFLAPLVLEVLLGFELGRVRGQELQPEVAR